MSAMETNRPLNFLSKVSRGINQVIFMTVGVSLNHKMRHV